MARAKVKKLNFEADKPALNWITLGSAFTTLAIWTTVNDPFNAPKQWVLSIITFWLLGWLLFNIKKFVKISTLKYATILSGLFILFLFFALIATDNKFIGFFGEYQRKTGFLTYFCLLILFLTSSYNFRLSNIYRLELIVVFTGFIMGIYSFAQHYNHDFGTWKNPYNPVIATLGNPDFAAALMSIFLIISFGVLIHPAFGKVLRSFAGLNVILLFIVIRFSQVRQGLLTTILGITIILIVWIYQKNKLLSHALSVLTFLSLTLALLGMLDKGPLIKYFYKQSVTFRGDYWRAAWRMFTNHPVFGVGLDRYGANFREFRDSTQSLRRGPELISNAAHNIPLQLASTGGILVLLMYLALVVFIGYRGFIAIKHSNGANQILAATIFASWIAYLAQSMISIDNIGIAIWGYVLGGAVIGLSLNPEPEIKINKNNFNQPLISMVLILIPLVSSILLFKSESSLFQLRSTRITPENINSKEARALIHKPLSYGLVEPNFQLAIAQIYADANSLEDSRKILETIVSDDPINYEANYMLARIAEVRQDWGQAILIRKHIEKFDPYNSINLYNLAVDLKMAGKIEEMKNAISRIDKFNLGGSESKKAHSELMN